METELENGRVRVFVSVNDDGAIAIQATELMELVREFHDKLKAKVHVIEKRRIGF